MTLSPSRTLVVALLSLGLLLAACSDDVIDGSLDDERLDDPAGRAHPQPAKGR